ncbi:MAG: MotA/TolQ/ExbB proton channel family protein [Zetaproteobacteria bacterium]|nr:MotA/TolQ/ExbB proton channel family protein [Zetaproteobacteria bacterium]
MLAFIEQGGIVMYILVAASLLAMSIIFERAWSLRRAYVLPEKGITLIESAVSHGDVETAVHLCQHQQTTMARILLVALKNRGLRRAELKEVIEEVGRQEIAHLERYIGTLGLIAAIAPLLGLLGTVVGMIDVFQVIANEGLGKADMLAGGISKALNTTAAGLTVAIPALVAYRMFESRINRFVIEIEHHAIQFVEMLKGNHDS